MFSKYHEETERADQGKNLRKSKKPRNRKSRQILTHYRLGWWKNLKVRTYRDVFKILWKTCKGRPSEKFEEKVKILELGNQGKYWLIIGWEDGKLKCEDP